MQSKIDEMIAPDTESVNRIIQGKREVADVSRLEKEVIVRIKVLCLGGIKKISKVFNNRVSNQKVVFIPLKRAIEGIGVNENGDCRDNKKVPVLGALFKSYSCRFLV